MQDVKLTWKADAARAAVPEGLDAGSRDADRVRVVPVRLEGARGQEHLCALETERARTKPNRVPSRSAGSFKTIGIDAS
jgi:hypothetical protein